MGTVAPSRRSGMCLEHLLGDFGTYLDRVLDKLFDQKVRPEKRVG